METKEPAKDLQSIEASLWNMANNLRGSMDASEYKNYILAFMFYRYLSEKQGEYLISEDLIDCVAGQTSGFAAMEELFGTIDLEEVRNAATISAGFTKLEKEKKDKNGLPVHDSEGRVIMEGVADWVGDYKDFVQDCTNRLGYCISPFYSWDVLRTLVAEHLIQPSDYQDMFEAFNYSLLYNKKSGKDFQSVFSDVNLGDSRLGTTTVERAKALGQIVELIDTIEYQGEQGRDILGSIYEYLIKQFAANAGKKGGEFYTPHEVSIIMAKIVTEGVKPHDQAFSVFDPTCGSGSLLLTVGNEVDKKAKGRMVSYFGQELNTTTYNLARMNLMMHDVDYNNMSLRNANTLGDDWPDGIGPDGKDHLRTFDAVVANPPYSKKWDAPESYLKDPRFSEYGGKLAPKSKADFAFLLDGLYHLNPEGTMAIVLPHGVLFRGAAEGAIRQALIEKNRIDTVIGLPANLFYGTGIPTIIIILKKNKTNRDILFIDASQEFKKAKNKNELTEDQINKIVETYLNRKDVDKYAHVASLDEIKANDYNLNIPRYVDTNEPEKEIDLAEVDRELAEVDAEIAKLQKEIDEQLKLLGVKF